ncbi:MAG: zinc-binding alcohol dehydrogenase family protein [Acidobacteriaceae bacterium]|nr:zinc-binding alcohol dehydrogenase family protein [Acidobacteriaceae bacterium]MBV9443057.1 zinc-binding alcohol dehydrogenase family protein [Acidobacteriaceae bacterium]
MNAAVVHSFASPPRYATFPEPVAAETEVLLDLIAAGLHPVVKALASGSHYRSGAALPFIPGVDGVARQRDGRRVYFGMSRAPFGTFCERTVTAGSLCIGVPEGLDSATVAAITNPGMSSWAALTKRAGFTAGENLLVLGATGVAGQLAIQIAKHLGARRIVAGGRNRKALERAEELGADAIVPLDKDRESLVSSIHSEWMNAGIDVVLDYVWGLPAEATLQAISVSRPQKAVSRVRFVQIGDTAGKTIQLPAAILRSSAIELLGSGFGSASIDELLKTVADFFQFAEKSRLKIDIKPVPLRDVEAIWSSAEEGARFVFLP